MKKVQKNIMVEICCGSFYDALQAAKGGAKRIELNSALMLGGLTPGTAALKLIKQKIPGLKVITMVRPRGAGFCYCEEEFQVMEVECRELLEAGADGVAFGCLKADGRIDLDKNSRLLSIIKAYNGEAVFHRAFDVVPEPFEAMEQLISLGVDRVLTSGLQAKAMEGAEVIRELQACYGTRIEILAGSGINAANACELLEKTGIRQIHSSCKEWMEDLTTKGNGVTYSMAPGELEISYDVVSARLVARLVEAVGKYEAERGGVS